MRLFVPSLLSCSPICRAASSLLRDQPSAGPFRPEDQQVLVPAGPGPDLVSSESYFQARGFAALGDSYSAGIGTGIDGRYLTAEGECRRGQHGYPLLLHADLDNRTRTNTTLQWLSCTGAVTTDLLSGVAPDSQVDALNTSLPLDFATLSIGGNDLGFFDVMNACVFRFYSWYSGTCEAALAASDAAIRGGDFERRLEVVLRQVLDRVAWERRPRFAIAVTGYARFFREDTPACDNMSLSVWWGGPRLTRDVRRSLNGLVDAANAKLRRTVDVVNARFRGPRPRVLFVGYDDLFDGHRFCEPGVVEPAYNRTDSWFFLVGGPDNARNRTTWPNGTNGDPEGSRSPHRRRADAADPRLLPAGSGLVDPERCLAGAQKRGDWGELALCYMATARARDPSLRPAYQGVTTQNGMWWVPTYYGKTFHPRTLGCEAIRNRIYEAWQQFGL